jgi:two-component system response regulator AtoC
MFQLPVELQALVDIHDQPFFIIDDGRRVVVVNRAFEETFGVERAKSVGTPCHQLMADRGQSRPCGADCGRCPFAETFTHQVARTSACSYLDAEGRPHLFRTEAHPISTQSGRTYVGVLIQRDAVRHHPDGSNGAGPQAHMVGNSAAYRVALDRMLLAASTDAPVLLLGETGTGKELAAAFIHRHSARRAESFQTLDCSVLTEDLFESEVFGHERGAFTGSVGEKRGLFELADGGTLFLDEIGELPMALQAKLLRVLESGEFRRVGGVKARHADVRIICATNRQLLGSSWFRSDLYYRVACVSVRLPSLSERRSDIPQLASELLARIGQLSARRYAIDDAALDVLVDYDYPGNVRELRNILWLAAVNALDGHITLAQIAAALPEPAKAASLTRVDGVRQVDTATLRDLVRRRSPRHAWDADGLAALLLRHGGNRRAAARELGVSERTVYRKLREYGLH